AAEHDHPDIRYTLVAVFSQRRIEIDQRLDHGKVVAATEAVQAGEDIGGVAAQVAIVYDATTGLDEAVAIAVDNDQDALATTALNRLDHEGVPVLELIHQAINLELVFHDAVQL